MIENMNLGDEFVDTMGYGANASFGIDATSGAPTAGELMAELSVDSGVVMCGACGKQQPGESSCSSQHLNGNSRSVARNRALKMTDDG